MKTPRVILCGLDRQPICSLSDRSGVCATNIQEKLTINEITTLSFHYPIINGGKWTNLQNEQLILFNNEYYRIKNLSINHDEDGSLYVDVECKHYSDNLANTMISLDEQTPLNVIDLMKVALCYDENGKSEFGWSIGNIEVDKVAKRGLEAVEQSPFSVLLTIADKYDGILKFNSQTMTIDMLKTKTTEHPVFDLRVSKNLKNFKIEYDTSEMYTRLYCYGATDDNGNELDITSVHPESKPYIENFDYFKTIGYSEDYINAHKEMFLSTNIWTDDVFVDPQELYDEGIKQLAKVSQPVVNVEVSALDMNVVNNDISKFELGDCVRVYDEDLGADVLCNVISRTKDYDNPHILNCEVTSAITYHDTLSQLFTNVNTVNKVVTSGGNLVGGQGATMSQVQDYLNLNYLTADQIKAGYVDTNTLKTYYLTAEDIRTSYLDADAIGAKYATIASLNAVEAKINKLDADTINAQFANINKLLTDYGEFHKLVATDAEIKQLQADNITVMGKLSADKAELDNLIASKVSANDFETYKATITELFATYATIEYLKANYVNAQDVEATYAKIAELNATNASISTLKADLANVEKLVTNKADISDLNAANAKIETLNADVANINKLITTKVDAEYVKTQIAEANKVITDDLKAIHAVVDTLDTKYATIEQLKAQRADLEALIAKKATIEELNAANASISNLSALVANINSILAGNIGTGTLQTIHLTASNVVIDDAVIKNANIEGLDVSKLTAGTISTDKFVIQSDDGGVVIKGSTQQFKDKSGKVRLQVGKDAQGNFNFIVVGTDGKTTLYDQDGIKSSAVPDGLIVDKMVADNAGIQGKKLDINSVVERINDNGTKTINSNKVWIDEDNQSVGAKFKSVTSSISDAKNSADNANTKIDNLQVGAVNMIRNAKTMEYVDYGIVNDVKTYAALLSADGKALLSADGDVLIATANTGQVYIVDLPKASTLADDSLILINQGNQPLWFTYADLKQAMTGGMNASNTYTKTQADSKFQPKGNYLTAVPDKYVTDDELTAKGYATNAQLAKKVDVAQGTSNSGRYMMVNASGNIVPVDCSDTVHKHSNKSVLDGITASKVNDWNNKSDFTGSYNDLTNKPVIPTKISQLTNDSNFLTGVAWGDISNKPATFAPSTHTHTELATKATVNKDTDWDEVTASGIYNVQVNGWGANKHNPSGAYAYGTLIVHAFNSSHIIQIYISHQGDVFTRETWSGKDSYVEWNKVYTTKNKPSKSDVGLGNVDNTADANKAVKSATNDSKGQNISTTYIKSLAISGKTITYTRGDNTTGTIVTQDTTYVAMTDDEIKKICV